MEKVEFRGARIAAAAGLGLTLALGAAPVIAMADAELGMVAEDAASTLTTEGGPSDDTASSSEEVGEKYVARVGDTSYTSFADAANNAKAGQTITLLANTQTTPVFIDEGVTVDLGGCTLSLVNKGKDQAGITFSGGSSVLKNGTVLDTCRVARSFAIAVTGDSTELTTEGVTITVQVPKNGDGYGVRVLSGADVTMNKGTVVNSVKASDGDKGYIYGVNVYGTGQGATFDEETATKLTVNDGVTIEAQAFAVSGNGDGKKDNTLITINGGTLKSTMGPAIYHPQYGKVVINGGTLDGESGIEIRAGELEVNGGTIKGNTKETIVYPKDSIGGGNSVDGGGIVVAQHSTKLPLKVTVNDGTVEANTSFIQHNVMANEDEAINKIELSIRGGNFSGKLRSDNFEAKNGKGFISGGTFTNTGSEDDTNDAVSELLAPGMTVDEESGTVSLDSSTSYEATVTDASGHVLGGYATLAEALAKAEPSSTVTLAKDVSCSAFSVPAGVALDGKGHTITCSDKVTIGAFVTVNADANDVTIKDVTIETNGNAEHGVQVYKAEGAVLDGVTVKGGSGTSVLVNGSEVTIRDCALNPDAGAYANIEYALGQRVTTIPEVTLEGTLALGDADYDIWADEGTAAKISAVLGSGATNDKILETIVGKVKNETRTAVGVAVKLEANEDPSTVVVDGKKPVTPPAQSGEAVSVEQSEGGKVSVTPSSAKEGETVTITVTPDEGKVVTGVTVTGKDGKTVAVKPGEKDGTWTFEMPGTAVTVAATFACDGGELCPSHAFSDLDPDQWYHSGTDWAIESGLMSGLSEGVFGPSEKLSRAQLAVVLWNRAGHPTADASAADRFVDVDPDGFYAAALDWCVETGAFMGLDDTHFSPSGDMTREQLAVVLWRMADEPESSYDLSGYPYGSDVSAFADTAMRWAVETGVLSGQGDGTLDPQGAIDRAQAAVIFQRLAE